MKLQRYGYGSSFNELNIHGEIIKKRSVDTEKIQKEMAFYRYVERNGINFPMVDILAFHDDGYDMKYLYSWIPLYKMYNGTDKVYKYLDMLHSHEVHSVSKEYFIQQLIYEIDEKIKMRYEKIREILKKYSHVTHVNDRKVMDFYNLLDHINNKLIDIVSTWNTFNFVPVHGDCQFNNILTNGEDIVFIDPRGYYGKSVIFGMKEYDYAKVLLALTGYDEFDNRNIDTLDITNHSIRVKLNPLEDNIFNNSEFVVLLMLNIWLGNAHSFSNNETKMVYSYFIALYLGTTYIEENHL